MYYFCSLLKTDAKGMITSQFCLNYSLIGSNLFIFLTFSTQLLICPVIQTGLYPSISPATRLVSCRRGIFPNTINGRSEMAFCRKCCSEKSFITRTLNSRFHPTCTWWDQQSSLVFSINAKVQQICSWALSYLDCRKFNSLLSFATLLPDPLLLNNV